MNKRLGNSAFELLVSSSDLVVPRPLIEPSRMPTPDRQERIALSRRGVLVGMTAGSATMAMAGWPGRALAASKPDRLAWSFAKDKFLELAKWFISEAIPRFHWDPTEKDVEHSEVAHPGGTHFHNGFACHYLIRKPVGVSRSKYGFCLALGEDGFLRAHPDEQIPVVKDLNAPELRRIRHLHTKNNKLLLFPCGPREAPTQEEKVRFSEHCQVNGLNREHWDLEYCRNINDGEHLHRGYAIKNKGIENGHLKGATDILIGDK